MSRSAQEQVEQAAARYQAAVEDAMRCDRPAVERELREAELALVAAEARRADETAVAEYELALAAVSPPGSGSAPF